MKKLLFVAAILVLCSAPSAFADHCAYCADEETCAWGATIGGVDCRIHFNPTWCDVLGFCNDWGAAPRSFNKNWKVTAVNVLTPEGLESPARVPKAVAVAAKAEPRPAARR